MFVSLKWKAVAFLSFVLVLISLLWIGQSVYHIIERYDDESQQTHLKHQQVLEQLLNDNFMKLSQFSQILGDKTESFQEADSQTSFSSFLGQQWLTLNINIGLDYIAVLKTNGEIYGKAYSPALINKPQKLEALFKAKLAENTEWQPQSLLYCEQACMQFVIEPIVQQDGKELYIVLGQNMADVIWRYHNLTNADLAVIISNSVVSHSMKDRVLPNWNSLVWAISRYDTMLPVIKDFSNSNKQTSLETSELFSYSDRYYLLRPLDLALYHPEGAAAQIIDIRDESEQQQQLWSSIFSGVATGLLALFLSEILLILLLLGPIQRLIYIADALNLLPKHQYQEVKDLIVRKPIFIKDELTQLEDSTLTVSNELEKLHEEVQKTNVDLTDKLSALSRSRSFLTRLLDNSNLYIVTQDSDFQILSTNSKYQEEVMVDSEGFLSVFSDNLSKQEFVYEIKRLIDRHTTEVFQQEIEILTEGGESLYVAWTHTLVENELGNSIILSIGMDLTQRKQDEVALKWLANNDTLTKIGNRRAFKKDVDYMLSSCQTGAVVFIDVNRFKQINDLYGHAVGDAVLIKLSEVLKETVRSNDSVSRLAGDEFTVVFQSIDEVHLERLLAKMSKAVTGSLTGENGQHVEYSASIGAALYPDHGKDLQSLTVHADMAMYQAKKKGLNQWHIFNPEDNNLAIIEEEQVLISLVRKALKPGAGLFHLVFQPILNIQNNDISHYEVLLRLHDEQGNPVFPDEFIPAAERMGLIRNIDEWVIDHAFARLESESKKRSNLKFAINVSAPTLQSHDLTKMFNHFFEQYQIETSQVVVELTETAYIDNFNQVLMNLETLNHAGFKIALDDFGVGFSSFSYLKKMPLSYVKLDGSYIKDLPDNRDNQIFVESLSKMVEAFGMLTIAEFVEDQATLDKLEELGVIYGQGYHIGKPLPELLD